MRRQMDNFNWYWGKMIQQTYSGKEAGYTEAGIPGQQERHAMGIRGSTPRQCSL